MFPLMIAPVLALIKVANAGVSALLATSRVFVVGAYAIFIGAKVTARAQGVAVCRRQADLRDGRVCCLVRNIEGIHSALTIPSEHLVLAGNVDDLNSVRSRGGVRTAHGIRGQLAGKIGSTKSLTHKRVVLRREDGHGRI